MTITIGYWELRGLVTPIKYLLAYKDVEYNNKVYPIGPEPDYERKEWIEQDKESLGLDFPNLPYLIEGDVKLTQSTTILRYLARKFDLNGKNEADQQRVDLAEQQATDIRQSLFKIAYDAANFDSLRKARLETLPKDLERFSKFLGERQFVAGDYVTYVDFILYDTFDFFRLFADGCLDATPNLQEFLKRIESLPKLDEFFKSDKFYRLPICGPMAHWGGKSEL